MEPTVKKILIAFVLVLTLGSVTVWYEFFRSSTAELSPYKPAASFTNEPPIINPSSSTSTQPQSQTPTTAVPDIAPAFSAIFQQLGAQEISFVSVNSEKPDSGIYALYKEDIVIAKGYAGAGTNLSIEVGLVDLNYDGASEAVVYENLPGFCGTGGCTLDIYGMEKGKWVKLFSGLTQTDHVALSRTLTNQYADLFVPVSGTIGAEADILRYTWDGKTYQEQKAIAVWNGSVFYQLK